MTDDPTGRYSRALEKGGRLASALAGVAVTAATGDPFVGATAGWASGEALAVGLDVMGRVTEHAAVRVGAAVQIMQSDSRMHEDAGETLRSDGFFDDRGLLRSESHELLEAILLTSANCFEERKLPYLAHLYDGVAHDGSVSASDALFLARTADQLTYRQLEGMAICGRNRDDMVQAEFAHIKAEHARGARITEPAFFREFNDLASRGLIGIWGSDEVVRDPPRQFGGALEDEAPGDAALTPHGALLHRLMRLEDLPDPDRRAWVDALRARTT